MIITKVEVDGVEFNDYQQMKVSRSIDQYNSSSNFSVTYDSPFGRHSTAFTIGKDIVIYADDTDGTTKLLTGLVERVSYQGTGTKQTITLIGRDYSLQLQDETVQPAVYTDSEISTIVTNIIDNNTDEITTNNVNVTDTTLSRIEFNHVPVFEALKKLSELAGFFFYIDNDKDLHFEKRDNVSSGIILDNTKLNKATLNETREGMANDIHVYGNRSLAGFQETFNVSGAIGSVTTLLSKPRNTNVTVDGLTQKGGIFQMTVIPTSGADYLVSYNDQNLVWQSGTEIGYSSIPTSGQQIIANYDREIPIVKTGQNQASIALYKRKEKIITDKSINDPNTASEILRIELEKSDPFRGFESNIEGWYDITPGNTARVTLSDFNIDEDVGILNTTYTFNKNTVQSEDIIRIKLDKKILDITDEITNIRTRLNAIEAADRGQSDLLTRLEVAQDQFSVVGSVWEIRTRSIAGDGLIWGNQTFGIWGSGLWRDAANTSFVLGNIQAAVLGTSKLGNNLSSFETIKSGGFYT